MAIGDTTAGLLFRIKADGSQADRELKGIKNQIGGLGGAMSSLGGPGVIAAAAITAVAVAAVAAAAGIFRLVKETADYGSEIFDATQKTNLGAESISALRFAAEQSGVSFEKITGSLSKFSVLLGKAALDETAAKDTLKDFNITATDTQTALEQAITTIASYSDHNKAAAAAAILFKDKTGDVLNVIKTLKGDLPGTIAELKKMGLVMSDEDARAADEFGDTLDLLGKQAAGVGRQFALGLMPAVTGAMQRISESMTNNGNVARSWGQGMGETLRGVEVYFGSLASAAGYAFGALARGFGATEAQSRTWGQAVRDEIASIIANFGLLFYIMNKIGEANPAPEQMGPYPWEMSPAKPVTPKMPSMKGVGGGGGGGGAAQDTSVSDAQARNQKLLAEFKASSESQVAENDLKLERMEISEQEHLAELYRIKVANLQKEMELLESELSLQKLNAKEREEIEHKIGLIKSALYKTDIENKKEITKADNDALDAAAAGLAELDKLKEENHQRELKRLKELNDKRIKAENDLLDAEKKRLDKLHSNKKAMQRIGGRGTNWEDLIEGLQADPQFKDNTALIAGIDAIAMAFDALGQAIGQVVHAWVLYGSAGASVRQVTAQILASVAQQAAVKAIFELAEGFAALAMAYFGIPNAGPSAAAHFQAAAIYGSIAGIAAIAGRGVAGDSFNQAASGGAGGGNSNGSQQQTNFGGRFNGFDQRTNAALDRSTMVIAQFEETLNRFEGKFMTASPEAVVMRGAAGASRQIRGAIESELSSDVGTTDGLMRGLGFAR